MLCNTLKRTNPIFQLLMDILFFDAERVLNNIAYVNKKALDNK